MIATSWLLNCVTAIGVVWAVALGCIQIQPGATAKRRTVALAQISTVALLIVMAGFFFLDMKAATSSPHGLSPTPSPSPLPVGISRIASSEETHRVRAVLRRANDTEFRSYQMLPTNINQQQLQAHFLETGPAYTTIMSMLDQHQRLGLTVGDPNNASYHRTVSVFEPIITGDRAEVDTLERWYLEWHFAHDKVTDDSRKVLLYKRHHYVIRKVNDVWKVEQDNY